MNLKPYAESCIEAGIYGRELFDLDAIRDKAREEVSQQADNATVYNSECLDIINRYEREHDADEDVMGDKTFKASEWQEAQTAYAFALAYTVISSMLEEILTALEEAADNLVDAAEEWGCEDTDEPRISTDCPHGWSPHDKEDEAGTCFWSEPNLEGCRAVAIRAAGFWLSYTWTPAETTEGEG